MFLPFGWTSTGLSVPFSQSLGCRVGVVGALTLAVRLLSH